MPVFIIYENIFKVGGMNLIAQLFNVFRKRMSVNSVWNGTSHSRALLFEKTLREGLKDFELLQYDIHVINIELKYSSKITVKLFKFYDFYDSF